MRGQLIDSQIVRLMQTAPVWTVSDVRTSLPRYSGQKVRGSLMRLRGRGVVVVIRPADPNGLCTYMLSDAIPGGAFHINESNAHNLGEAME